MLKETTHLLNTIIKNPDLIKEDNGCGVISNETVRIENEIRKILEHGKINKDSITEMIFRNASIKYSNINSINHITEKLRSDFNTSPLSAFSLSLFSKTVTAITLDKSYIKITLKNNQKIGGALWNKQYCSENSYRQIRVAAYCRVSTQMEEQLNSYEVQVKHYTDKINSEPKWSFAGIYADKGISGTSAKKRDEFMKMIRACKRHKIDMIITKSISRFSRNTLDCLKYIRILKELNVDVYFEEQGLHSKDAGAEFYITIYGSIAQSEAENISANVKWGKQQSAKEGKVSFSYNSFLGYKKGADGKPEIVEDEAKVVREIFDKYLEGESVRTIAKYLTANQIATPTGKEVWHYGTVKSILSNEKYKGDALINKTYVVDCISKKVKRNNGERAQYYVENNHPAIISPEKFNRVQEEMARRTSKKKVKQIGTKTELGKYSSKYALSELLICGECHTPYRRCTWTTTDGKKKIMWRCINRLDYGKKYCHHSPSVEESVLQKAIVQAVQNNIGKCSEVLEKLKQHIKMGLSGEQTEDKTIDIQIEIARLDKEYVDLLNQITADIENAEALESQLEEIIIKKHSLQNELQIYENSNSKQANTKTRLDEIFQIIEGLKNHPMEFNDVIIRQIIDCIIVESKEKIKVVFVGGYEVEQRLCSD